MFFITICNCTTVIASLFVSDSMALDAFEILDKIYLSIYIAEFLMKVIALGVEDYFDDDWYYSTI